MWLVLLQDLKGSISLVRIDKVIIIKVHFLKNDFDTQVINKMLRLEIRNEERHEGHFMDYPAQRFPDKAN